MPQIDLTPEEIRLLVVAVRQVRNTFAIGQSQLEAAGQSLDPQYKQLDGAYLQLLERLSALAPAPADKLQRVK